MSGIFYSLVRRHMKLTSPEAFTKAEPDTVMPVDLQLAPTESVVGWYRNPLPWDTTLIVFTTEGFYLCDPEGTQRVMAKDIVDYQRPESKETVDGVTVITNDGPIFVRVAGTFGPNGQQKDAYSFIMMLRGWLTVHRPDWTAPSDAS